MKGATIRRRHRPHNENDNSNNTRTNQDDRNNNNNKSNSNNYNNDLTAPVNIVFRIHTDTLSSVPFLFNPKNFSIQERTNQRTPGTNNSNNMGSSKKEKNNSKSNNNNNNNNRGDVPSSSINNGNNTEANDHTNLENLVECFVEVCPLVFPTAVPNTITTTTTNNNTMTSPSANNNNSTNTNVNPNPILNHPNGAASSTSTAMNASPLNHTISSANTSNSTKHLSVTNTPHVGRPAGGSSSTASLPHANSYTDTTSASVFLSPPPHSPNQSHPNTRPPLGSTTSNVALYSLSALMSSSGDLAAGHNPNTNMNHSNYNATANTPLKKHATHTEDDTANTSNTSTLNTNTKSNNVHRYATLYDHPSGGWLCHLMCFTEREANHANGSISINNSLMLTSKALSDAAKGRATARVIPSYAQVRERYGLSHVLLSCRHQYLSRSDLFTISEALRNRVVYAGEEINLYGFTLRVSEMLYTLHSDTTGTSSPSANQGKGNEPSSGNTHTATAGHHSPPSSPSAGSHSATTAAEIPPEPSASFDKHSSHSQPPHPHTTNHGSSDPQQRLVRVACGLVTAETKVNFESRSPVYYIIIEVSREMWDTTMDGRIALSWTFRKFLAQFLGREMPKRKVAPLLRILFTGRLRKRFCINGQRDVLHMLEVPPETRGVDLATEAELHCDSFVSRVLREVKEAALARLMEEQQRDTATATATSSSSFKEDSEYIRRLSPKDIFVLSKNSNTLETLCVVLERCGLHYIDRRLATTGHAITVLTGGKGLWRATNNLVQVITTRLHDVGLECVYVVCIGRPPLHVTPLLEYRAADETLRSQYHLHSEMQDPNQLFHECPVWLSVLFYYPQLESSESVVEASFILLTKEEWLRRYRGVAGALGEHYPPLPHPHNGYYPESDGFAGDNTVVNSYLSDVSRAYNGNPDYNTAASNGQRLLLSPRQGQYSGNYNGSRTNTSMKDAAAPDWLFKRHRAQFVGIPSAYVNRQHILLPSLGLPYHHFNDGVIYPAADMRWLTAASPGAHVDSTKDKPNSAPHNHATVDDESKSGRNKHQAESITAGSFSPSSSQPSESNGVRLGGAVISASSTTTNTTTSQGHHSHSPQASLELHEMGGEQSLSHSKRYMLTEGSLQHQHSHNQSHTTAATNANLHANFPGNNSRALSVVKATWYVLHGTRSSTQLPQYRLGYHHTSSHTTSVTTNNHNNNNTPSVASTSHNVDRDRSSLPSPAANNNTASKSSKIKQKTELQPDAAPCGLNIVDSDLRNGYLVLEVTLRDGLLPNLRWNPNLVESSELWGQLLSCFHGRDGRLRTGEKGLASSTAAVDAPPAGGGRKATAVEALAMSGRGDWGGESGLHGEGSVSLNSGGGRREEKGGATASVVSASLSTPTSHPTGTSPVSGVGAATNSIATVTAAANTTTAAAHAFASSLRPSDVFCFTYSGISADGRTLILPTHSNNCSFHTPEMITLTVQPFMFVLSKPFYWPSPEVTHLMHPSQRVGDETMTTTMMPMDHDTERNSGDLSQGGKQISSSSSSSSDTAKSVPLRHVPFTAAPSLQDLETHAHLEEPAIHHLLDSVPSRYSLTVTCGYVQLRSSLLFALKLVDPLYGDTGGGEEWYGHISSENISTSVVFKRRWLFKHPQLQLEPPQVASWTSLCSCNMLPLYGARSAYPRDAFYTIPPHQYTIVSNVTSSNHGSRSGTTGGTYASAKMQLTEFVIQRLQQQYQIVVDAATPDGHYPDLWPREEPTPNVRLEMSAGHQVHTLKIGETLQTLSITRMLHRGMYTNGQTMHMLSYAYLLWNYLQDEFIERKVYLEAQVGEKNAFAWEELDRWLQRRPDCFIPRGEGVSLKPREVALVLVPEDPSRPPSFDAFLKFISYRFSALLYTRGKVEWEEERGGVTVRCNSSATTTTTGGASENKINLVEEVSGHPPKDNTNTSTDDGEGDNAEEEAHGDGDDSLHGRKLMHVVLSHDNSQLPQRHTRVDPHTGATLSYLAPVEERLMSVDIALPRSYHSACCYSLRVSWLACTASIVSDWYGSFIANAARYGFKAIPIHNDYYSVKTETLNVHWDVRVPPFPSENSKLSNAGGQPFAMSAEGKVELNHHNPNNNSNSNNSNDNDNDKRRKSEGEAEEDTSLEEEKNYKLLHFRQRLCEALLERQEMGYYPDRAFVRAPTRFVHCSGVCYVVIPRSEECIAQWYQNGLVCSGTAEQMQLLSAFQAMVRQVWQSCEAETMYS